jgi:amidase
VSAFIERFDRPRHGRRVAVKDLMDLAGSPTTNGSRVIAASAGPAAADATCLAGTRAAEVAREATIVGKTNLHELAFGVSGINPWFGTPVNPLDPALVPGGSSSGSAVAVATGEADIAFGSDTGGSIRIPAACCGVVGLKTTRNRIPLGGVLPLAPSLDTVGPMAATVALVTEGMALLEPGFSVDGVAPARVGRLRLPAERWIDAAIETALTAADLEVIDVALPGWDEATTAAMTILSSEAWNVHGDLWRAHAAELSPDVSARLEGASLLDAEDVAASWEVGRQWHRRLAAVLAEVGILALPTLAAEPPTIEDSARLSDIRYASPFNLAGVPAISLPIATTGRLPASLQLVGPAGSEALLLATAAAVEAASGWTGSV